MPKTRNGLHCAAGPRCGQGQATQQLCCFGIVRVFVQLSSIEMDLWGDREMLPGPQAGNTYAVTDLPRVLDGRAPSTVPDSRCSGSVQPEKCSGPAGGSTRERGYPQPVDTKSRNLSFALLCFRELSGIRCGGGGGLRSSGQTFDNASTLQYTNQPRHARAHARTRK